MKKLVNILAAESLEVNEDELNTAIETLFDAVIDSDESLTGYEIISTRLKLIDRAKGKYKVVIKYRIDGASPRSPYKSARDYSIIYLDVPNHEIEPDYYLDKVSSVLDQWIPPEEMVKSILGSKLPEIKETIIDIVAEIYDEYGFDAEVIVQPTRDLFGEDYNITMLDIEVEVLLENADSRYDAEVSNDHSSWKEFYLKWGEFFYQVVPCNFQEHYRFLPFSEDFPFEQFENDISTWAYELSKRIQRGEKLLDKVQETLPVRNTIISELSKTCEALGAKLLSRPVPDSINQVERYSWYLDDMRVRVKYGNHESGDLDIRDVRSQVQDLSEIKANLRKRIRRLIKKYGDSATE